MRTQTSLPADPLSRRGVPLVPAVLGKKTMHYVSGYDEPRGILIGDFYTAWQIFYDGRPQGQKQYADTATEAEAAGRAAIDKLKAECKGATLFLYQDDTLWRIRLWG